MKTLDDREIITDHRPRHRPRSIDLRPRVRRSWLESPEMAALCPLLMTFAGGVLFGGFLQWLYGGR